MNAYEKLQAARLALQNMALNKSGENKFSNYKYFELGDFLPQTQSIFSEVKLCGVVSFRVDVATLTIVNVEKPDDKIVFESPMSSAALKGMHDIQNLGAVQTYLRRYLWMAAMEIVEHDAVDRSDKPEAKKAATQKPQSGTQDPETAWDDLEDPFLHKLKSSNDIASLSAAMNSIPQADKAKYTKAFNERMAQLKSK